MKNENISNNVCIIKTNSTLPAYFDFSSGIDRRIFKHMSMVKGSKISSLQNSNCLLTGFYKRVVLIMNIKDWYE